jgi:two-component system cell cycle response regulator
MDAAGPAIETSTERESRRLARVRADVRADPVLRGAALIAVCWLAGYALATASTAPGSSARCFVGDVVYMVPVFAAAVLAAAAVRRTTGRRRRTWRVLAISNALWLGGELVWAGYAYIGGGEAPFPSVADLLYLASYVLVPVAVLVGFGGTDIVRRARGVLDAVVATAGVGSLGWETLIRSQVADGWSLAAATGAAYPLLGMIIVVTLVSVGLAGHQQVPPSMWLVGAAFTVSAATDSAYTYLESVRGYSTGGWLNLGWQLEAVLLCLAALCACRHAEGDGQITDIGRDVARVPVLIGVAAAVVLASTQALGRGMDPVVVAAADFAICGLTVRFTLSVGDHRRTARRLDQALHEQERLAITDGLTGLYNRRFGEEVLRIEADRAARQGTPIAVIVADLDRFKAVNDTYGHTAGDAVLIEAAQRLRRTVRDVDVVARYGGEEFVVILPAVDAEVGIEVAERCRLALGAEPVRLGDGTAVAITGSFGVAALPEHAGTVDALIQQADRALYAAKSAGRNSVAVTASGTRSRSGSVVASADRFPTASDRAGAGVRVGR